MYRLILILSLFLSDKAISQSDPLRDVLISSKLNQISEELRIQASENEYWVVSEDQIKAFQALSLGDFLKFKMKLISKVVALKIPTFMMLGLFKV